MAAKKKPAPYSRPRKSREQGELALLEAAAALLSEKSPDQVTTADIAERAGLNRAHIVRYFGTRSELLASTVDHYLTKNVLSTDIPDAQSIVESRMQLEVTVQWYMRVVSYLLSIDVPPKRFHPLQQAVSERAGQIMDLPNASPRLKAALVNMAILLMQGTPVFGDLDELTERDRMDILLVMTHMQKAAGPLDKALGWDK